MNNSDHAQKDKIKELILVISTLIPAMDIVCTKVLYPLAKFVLMKLL